MKKTLAALLCAACAMGAAHAATPLWLRDVQIAPDGRTIAFTYKGDIYTVPSTGGTATRLTTWPSHESAPVWSPDSRTIAFASDREGGQDVWAVSAQGGPAVRLTSNSAREIPTAFTPDGLNVVYTAYIQAPASSSSYPSGRLSQLWKVPAGGGRPVQVLGTPALNVKYVPGQGESFVYTDDKGTENEWRKHHTSSVTRDIWLYDASTGRHTNLTARGGEDRNPVPGAKGSGKVYFLSERDGGASNVYSLSLSAPAQVQPVTRFEKHPVRFLSRSDNGTLAFGWDGEIYTMPETGGKPAKVAVDIVRDDAPAVKRINVASAQGAVPSPDGSQLAFSHRGDIFVTSVEYPTTRQVTATAQGEDSPSWGKDGRTLYYNSDREGYPSIWRARLAREDDPNFANAMLIDEEPVFAKGDRVSRMNPLVSPDGKKLAFVQDGNKIAVADIDSRKVRLLTHGETYTASDGGIEMEWSPDSRWLVATVDVHQRDPYYDIAVFNTETGAMTLLSDDAYMNSTPHWVMNGNAVIYTTDRYGMKNHASWGATGDVLMTFMNQDAYDRYRLSKEDLALLKEAEKANKKGAATPAKDTPAAAKGKGQPSVKGTGPKDKDKKADAQAKDSKAEPTVKPIEMELEGIQDRTVRLTPFSASICDAWVDNDGDNLYFMAKVDKDYDMWKKDLRSGSVSLFKKLGVPAAALRADAQGKNLFLAGSRPQKMSLPGGSLSQVTFNATHDIDPQAEREYMYDYILDTASRRFLVKDMFGADWKGLGKHYRKFLPHIADNHDFAILASELLGELNVSHSGSGYRAPAASQPTAQLGLLYDLAYTGPGLKVAEVLKGGPFDRKSSQMAPGAVITAIGGTLLTESSDPLALLADRAKTKTLVAFTLPGGAKKEEVVIPTTAGAVADMMYDRWVERNRHLVDSLSGGRLGYVHLESMDDASYRRIYADVLGRYAHREGIVIDTRFNGGGRLHEDIEVLFSGHKYLTQERRGIKSGEMPSKRWLRPSIMVTGEANYSNAHGTPWMYSHNKLGKLVGMPVPGTMSSVNWITLQDPTLYFGVPVVAFRTAEGNYLENTQLEPDVKVANDPALVVKGRDQQLETAVRTLLDDIDSAAAKAK